MQNNLARLTRKFLGLTYNAGGMRLTFTEVDPEGTVLLLVDDAASTGHHRMELRLQIVSGDQVPQQATIFEAPAGRPLLALYPGHRRHPLGHRAPTSWMNETGDGLLAVAGNNVLINVMLTGLNSNRIVPVPDRTRGRPNSSSLWLSVVAIALPINLSRRQLLNATHFSDYTIDEWFKQAVANGWLSASANTRSRLYTATVPGIAALAEFIEAKWQDWRQGRHRDRFGTPTRRYFVSKNSLDHYDRLVKNVKQPLIRTGISVLEERANLVPSGSLREMAFITTKEGLYAIAAESNLEFSEQRDVPGASEVMILRGNHPLFGLQRERSLAQREEWPLGLASLDALDHPNPRVSMLAKECWRKWIEETQTINVITFGEGRARQPRIEKDQ